jgi:phage-related minor tail protein
VSNINIFSLVGTIALEGQEKVKEQLQGIQGYVKDNEKGFKDLGTAMTVAGAAITGALVLSVKSAADEEAGVIKLSQALKNVGVNYDDVKDSLEGVISANQKKTGIADDQQRAAMQSLLEVTGDYQASLDLLPLALDLATAKGIDAASASQIVGKVAQGNTGILARYGIVLQDGATATEALGELQAKFGGQAEAYGQTMSGQIDTLKNSFGDLMEDIGSVLLPLLKDLFSNISPIIENIRNWMEENPELTKTIVLIVGALGGLMIILGPLLIMLPGLIAGVGAFGTVMTIATGPVGLIILGIAALVAGGIALVANWDKVKLFFGGFWSYLKEGFGKLTSIMLFPFKVYFTALKTGVNFLIDMLNKIRIDIPDWVPGIGGKGFGVNLPHVDLPDFLDKWAQGGTITQPTLLTRLSDMKPYAIAGEAGSEVVSPMGRGQMMTVIMEMDGRQLASALMPYAVGEIRLRTGLKI